MASAALEEIRASGYNVARVFLTPQCMTMDMPRWTLNATVVSWDLFEQPQFWNMKDGGGAINAAVAPVARGYGTGGLAAGFYLVQGVAVIFHNGSNAACTYATWEDFTDSTGTTSAAGLPNVLGAGAVRMTTCPLIARTGPFQYLNNLYYSNGDTAYCRFATWQDYMNMTGLATAPQSVLLAVGPVD